MVGGGYENTDIGQIVTLAFIQAYSKLVNDSASSRPATPAPPQAAPAKTFTAQGRWRCARARRGSGKVIRTLPAGAIVYPTGNKKGLWWEVADENDNVGWVLNTKLAPSQ